MNGRPDPVAFGRGLPQGLGINLIVPIVRRSVAFQQAVLGAEIQYEEEHFAIARAAGSAWLVHSDWSYREHELAGVVAGQAARGAGIELRLYGVDPDRAEAAARLYEGAIVLSGSVDKPHGLREAHILDQDGFVWVPCRATHLTPT